MRKCLMVLCLLIYSIHPLVAQPTMNKSYETRWKSVESLMTKGLHSSAQKEIALILKQAKSEQNIEQYIKALCNYRVSAGSRDETSRLNDIQFFEKEAVSARFPAKQILHSMIAELYWSYYQEHQWEILDRTTVAHSVQSDHKINPSLNNIETWSADDFYSAVYRHYWSSLSEPELQKTFLLSSWTLIIDPGVNTQPLRPTLYDLLVHRAIDYFRQEENELTKPEYAFDIYDTLAFAPASAFIQSQFKTSDTLSQKYTALQLYQDILAFHSHDKDPSALIDADLARIQYVYSKGVMNHKEELYIKALKSLAARYPSNEQAAMARFLWAETMTKGSPNAGRGYGYNLMDESKLNYIEAKRICEEIISAFPKGEAGYRAQVLLAEIEQHGLSIQTEKAVLPNKPSLALINYRNISTLYCRVVSLQMKEYKDLNYDYTERFDKLMNKPMIKQWQVDLPNKEDYKNHSTEIKIDGLPLGTYAVIISEHKDFSAGNSTLFSYLQVTNLAFITATQTSGNVTSLYIVHRESGQPITGATVKLWSNQYDYDSRTTKLNEVGSYVTKQDGLVQLTADNKSYIPEVILKTDALLLFDNIYVTQRQASPGSETNAFLFTDRSIYRPGQTIYFKAIILSSTTGEARKHELLKNRVTTVALIDANGQLIKEEKFITNEFGSLTGTFQAPEGLLTGQYSIRCENQETSVNVEEYKRPKFEVVFDTLQKSYRLNEEIEVTAHAKAFAGNSISGAKVTYTVIREARFPYLWCFYRWGQPSSPRMMITQGSGLTKDDGSIQINFTAIPDASIDKKTMPVFDYTVNLDITDVNGETRSGRTSIPISYQTSILQLDIPKNADVHTFNQIKVRSNNLSGAHVPSSVTLILKKLVSPTKTLRTRLWPKAELLSIPEKDFRIDFPLDEYDNENDYQQWKDEKVVWTKTVTTTKDGNIDLQKMDHVSGWFVLEAKAIDKNGEALIDKKFIRLSDYQNPEPLPNEHVLVSRIKLTAEPGETAQLALSYPYDQIYMLYQAQSSELKWMDLHYPKNVFNYAITEADRGGFYIHTLFIKNNRYYEHTEHVYVPWTNKDLTISTETFRNKMLPGSEQEWTLKITGKNKDKVAAELLTTMYDASLDVFRPHQWRGMNLFQENDNTISWSCGNNFMVESGRQIYYREQKNIKAYNKRYGWLNSWGLLQTGDYGVKHMLVTEDQIGFADQAAGSRSPKKSRALFTPPALNKSLEENEPSSETDKEPIAWSTSKTNELNTPTITTIPLRSNFSETAFFFPQLHTDEEGNVRLTFKAPEALTQWKWMAYAHTTDLKEALFAETSITQKVLMVIPNTPRFLREGDRMIYSVKISNLQDKLLRGAATLLLEDGITHRSMDALFENKTPNIPIQLQPGESISAEWEIVIPKGFSHPVTIKTLAKVHGLNYPDVREEYMDGEQHVVPVLLNSMMVTETLPMAVKMNSIKNFQFAKLLKANQSSTLQHHRITIEYTANPAWYAIQALPYLTDYPYECAEQTFNRFYANALAAHLANSHPKIKEVFSDWQEDDSTALLSSLHKNQELKSAILQETPWVMDAKNEVEQKKNLALLFNMTRMSSALEKTVKELYDMQTPNGGFSWFKGMPDDRFVTQYIVTGLGRLLHMKVMNIEHEKQIQALLDKAIPYLDARLKEDYTYLIQHKMDLKKNNISYSHIQYLYMRSFFMEKFPINISNKISFEFYQKQCGLFWLNTTKYMQAMSAIALYRMGKVNIAKDIVQALREQAIHSDELGMYWKDVRSSYWWYEAPIETQAMMIECFNEIAQRESEVNELKIWLLKNKQTSNWKTTKATADACYALLLNGLPLLNVEPDVRITMGGKRIEVDENEKEAGTGYFKTSIEPDMIKPSLGDIQVSVRNENNPAQGITWGTVYWQYLEQLDKITSAETPLSLNKQLFKVARTAKGEVLLPITDLSPLEVGDQVRVRIELRVDRSMEYVHLKDMRAACFEPINVISGYKYQGGLGYYEATKDLATHFFFNGLEKGTYVFEYPMFTTHEGDFSNGIATIQCMYAPEFSSHSEGLRVKVK